MKKWSIPIVFILALNTCFTYPASSATASVRISKNFSGTFTTSLKYSGNDCATFQFKWTASTGMNYPYHWIAVTVQNQSKKSISQTFYIKPGDYYGLGQGSGVWKKTEKWELCQSTQEVLEDEDCDPDYEAQYGRECEYVEVGGINPGKYTVQAVLYQLQPVGSWNSNKVTLVISK